MIPKYEKCQGSWANGKYVGLSVGNMMDKKALCPYCGKEVGLIFNSRCSPQSEGAYRFAPHKPQK